VYVPRLKKRTALLVKVKTVVQRHRSHMPALGSDLLEGRTFISGVTAAECRTGLCDGRLPGSDSRTHGKDIV